MVGPISEAIAAHKIVLTTRSAKRTTPGRNSAQGEINSDGGSIMRGCAPLSQASQSGCRTQSTSGPSTSNAGLSATLRQTHQRLDSASRRAGKKDALSCDVGRPFCAANTGSSVEGDTRMWPEVTKLVTTGGEKLKEDIHRLLGEGEEERIRFSDEMLARGYPSKKRRRAPAMQSEVAPREFRNAKDAQHINT